MFNFSFENIKKEIQKELKRKEDFKEINSDLEYEDVLGYQKVVIFAFPNENKEYKNLVKEL